MEDLLCFAALLKHLAILSATTERFEAKKSLPLRHAPFAGVKFDLCVKTRKDGNIPGSSVISNADVSGARNR